MINSIYKNRKHTKKMSFQNIIIDKKIFEYDISQVFYCYSIINIIRTLTECEIYNKKKFQIIIV